MSKKQMMKRGSTAAMAVILAGISLAGCGAGSSENAPAATTTAGGSESSETVAKNSDKPFEGVKLTWWTTLNANVSSNYQNLGDTPWAKYVQEQTGIEIEFQHPTQGSESEDFAVMTASGEYPDIIEYTWTKYPSGAGAAINDGVIISIDDMMEKNCPNLSKLLAEHPDIDKMVKDSSGRHYCFPFLRGTESPNETEFSSGFIYRADILKDAGLDVPETPDDWEKVLRAYKDAGFEVPFVTRNEWMKDIWSPGFDNWGDFYVDDDGKVKNGLVEDSRKEFITWMNKMYTEGLIDNDWLVADKKSNQTYFTTGKSAAVYAPFGQGLGSYGKVMKEQDPDFDINNLQCAPPVTSQKGKNAKFSKMNNIFDKSGTSAAISTECKNTDAAAWLLDWMYSEEGNLVNNFGIEGQTYEMKDGKPVYTDFVLDNPEGKSAAEILAGYTRASTSGTCVQDPQYILQYYSQDNQKAALAASMKTDMGKHFFPPASVSEEEQDEYADIITNVKTLSDEMEAQFINGTTPLTEWDNYQKQLKDFGIEKAIGMMQKTYDTYIAN
ncbi:hypothetical protein BXO88_14425 [Oribacterium sp. C9]|uniref:extracellular solute-binding protein n=1 Tax=Oribacterium sp. C9 TaxID=1943579 RepID=UPI00098FB5B5|nr:extracellular solute-binding protein [Oribacterium sp. C9]OON85040.1 hypothetical protein BXO88_14425 [Oribacterium sp. C9]